MFDFAWSEIALIAIVALIAIGPKDMPVAIRAVTGWIKKARRMAAEFQTHVDEMVREADLHEVRSSISEIRNFDIRGEIERNVDPDGSIRGTFASNPLEPTAAAPAVAPAADAAVSESNVSELEKPAEVATEAVPPPTPAPPHAPSFIPPNMVPPPGSGARSGASGSCNVEHAVEPEAPAFIPPDIVLQRRRDRQSDH
jgi:sec-independent protein translocase protein TatB